MYKYYQPNEKDIKDKYGDCVIRAFCKLTGKNWKDTFDMLLPLSYKYQRMPNSIDNVKEVIEKDLKFTPMKVNVRNGGKRPTVKSLTKKYKCPMLVQVSNHVVACNEGNYYDTWDSGDKSVYKYWIKEEFV